MVLWIIYGEYFKKSIRINSFIRFLKWYVWLVFSLIMLAATVFYFLYVYFNFLWILPATLISGGLGGLYFGNEVRKVANTQVGNYEDIFDNDLITLRQILSKRNINKENQIEVLLKQIDEELPNLKISESVLKPIYTLSTFLLLPIVTLLLKWLLEKDTNGLFLSIQIIVLIVMIFSIVYMIKTPLAQLMERTYWKMKKLKQMLQDILLIDYFK